jgi:DNA-binding response OmpR family regulator
MPKKILVVEDENDVAVLLADRLKSAGYEVLTAPDAMYGTQCLQRFKPDLVILDLMLPAGGGLSVLRSLRRTLQGRIVPVIILTAKQDDAYKKQILELGVNAYMQKPYDAHELLAEVGKLAGAPTESNV